VLLEVRDRVRILTINRPRVRNALDATTLTILADVIEAATNDAAIGALVLEGAGDVCFCAGMDLRSVERGDVSVGEVVGRFHHALRSPERVPIVAAVRGMAVGGGFELITSCDLAVAADNARFALPEVTHGLVPGGGALLLAARIPLAAALEIGLLGEFWPASRLLQLGLLNRVVAPDEVRECAIDLARRLAEQPPATLARIRHLMTVTATEGPTATVASAEALGMSAALRAEAAAGISRFLSRSHG
jgi:enoyl-CoA hydratase